MHSCSCWFPSHSCCCCSCCSCCSYSAADAAAFASSLLLPSSFALPLRCSNLQDGNGSVDYEEFVRLVMGRQVAIAADSFEP